MPQRVSPLVRILVSFLSNLGEYLNNYSPFAYYWSSKRASNNVIEHAMTDMVNDLKNHYNLEESNLIYVTIKQPGMQNALQSGGFNLFRCTYWKISFQKVHHLTVGLFCLVTVFASKGRGLLMRKLSFLGKERN